MKNELPVPIKNHLLKLKIALVGFATIGSLLGLVSRDKIILLLTGLIVAGGAAKLWHLAGVAKRGEYEVISGVVLANQQLHHKHKLILACDDGPEQVLILSGSVSSQVKCTLGGADIFLDLNPKNAIVYYDDANFMLLTEGTS